MSKARKVVEDETAKEFLRRKDLPKRPFWKIAADDWRRHLHTGDEVTWTVRVGASTSTKTGTIVSIEYLADDTAMIVWADGCEDGVFLSELS